MCLRASKSRRSSAAHREFERTDPAVIEAALARGRAALDGLGGFEAADLIRAEREGRDERSTPHPPGGKCSVNSVG